MKKDSFAWRLLLGNPPGPQRELVPGEMREFSVFTENGVEHRVWRGHPECGADFTVEITLAPRPDGLFAARFAFRGYAGKAHVEEIRFPSYHEPAGPGTRVLAGCHALGGIFDYEFFRDDPSNRAAYPSIDFVENERGNIVKLGGLRFDGKHKSAHFATAYNFRQVFKRLARVSGKSKTNAVKTVRAVEPALFKRRIFAKLNRKFCFRHP